MALQAVPFTRYANLIHYAPSKYHGATFMKRTITGLVFAFASLLGSAASAEDAKVEDVVGGLSNPCGVAVQPGTGVVFVSDSATGRVCRVVDGKLEDVIAGSAKDVYGKGPFYDIGPLGLLFLD